MKEQLVDAAERAADELVLELVDEEVACFECGDVLEPGFLQAVDGEDRVRCIVCAGEVLRARANDEGAQ